MEKRQQIVNFDTQEKTEKFIDNEGIVDQKTLALYFLMSVTGVREISNYENMKIFIYRLQFVFTIMKIEQGNINVGELFCFLDKQNNSISFTFANLNERIGMNINMLELESVSENEFFETIPFRYKYAFIADVYEEQAIAIFDSNLYTTIFLNTKEIKCNITSKMKEDALQKTNLTLSKLKQYNLF